MFCFSPKNFQRAISPQLQRSLTIKGCVRVSVSKSRPVMSPHHFSAVRQPGNWHWFKYSNPSSHGSGTDLNIYINAFSQAAKVFKSPQPAQTRAKFLIPAQSQHEKKTSRWMNLPSLYLRRPRGLFSVPRLCVTSEGREFLPEVIQIKMRTSFSLVKTPGMASIIQTFHRM